MICFDTSNAEDRIKMKLRSHDELASEFRATQAPDVAEFETAAREYFRQVRLETFEIGRRFADRRKELRVSQRELAARAEVTQADLSRIERGLANPTLLTLTRIANTLDLEISLTVRE